MVLERILGAAILLFATRGEIWECSKAGRVVITNVPAAGAGVDCRPLSVSGAAVTWVDSSQFATFGNFNEANPPRAGARPGIRAHISIPPLPEPMQRSRTPSERSSSGG